ncbi:MAG: hypothetical protein ABIV28_09040 [Longimicrobiales bacterium]
MKGSAESEGKRSLARLRRAIEKAARELESVQGALRHAEGSDFPEQAFSDAMSNLRILETFVDEQEERLADKILHAGGLEPGRVRRSGG